MYCDQHVCVSLCLFVLTLAHLKKHTSKFHQIVFVDDDAMFSHDGANGPKLNTTHRYYIEKLTVLPCPCVCFSHNISKTDVARITKLERQ